MSEMFKNKELSLPKFADKKEFEKYLFTLLSSIREEFYDEIIVDVLDKVDTVRNYKDTVFKMLFSDKNNLLELYNAVNGTCYTNVEDLEINTLENAIFLNLKNDISFVFNFEMNLYEHQSTLSPNMPLRDLFYVARLYQKWLKVNSDSGKRRLFDNRPIKIPVPKFVVFYNGLEEQDEVIEYRLSDLFMKKNDEDRINNDEVNMYGEKESSNPELELVVKVYNVNYGKNKLLQKHCKTLEEYGIFVLKVRENIRKLENKEHIKLIGKELDIRDIRNIAIEIAIDECIKEGILTEFLKSQRDEVMDVGFSEIQFEEEMAEYFKARREYDYELIKEELRPEVKKEVRQEVEQEVRQEVEQEVRQEVEQKVKLDMILELYSNKKLSLSDAMEIADIPKYEFLKKFEEYKEMN